jgi:hypothetical protein
MANSTIDNIVMDFNVALKDNNYTIDSLKEKFKKDYNATRVRISNGQDFEMAAVCSSAEPPIFKEVDNGNYFIINQEGGIYLLPTFSLGNFAYSQKALERCYDVKLPENVRLDKIVLDKVTKLAKCSREGSLYKLLEKGELQTTEE